ncbi:MAG TPA: hypothetical protein VLB67_02365 [Acidimicrobiia bacterium]|nr:hypothetical protein [Acidimicrobiia bacterium]
MTTHPLTSAHGFEFSGDITHFGLRENAARTTVRVRNGTVAPVASKMAIGHWPAIPGKRAEVTIVAVDGSHVVTVGNMARFRVDTEASTIVSQYAEQLPPMLATTTLMSSPAAICIVQSGRLALHAGAVELGGRSVLLAAPGTGGKTTLAAAFHTAGYRALSDDLVGVDPVGVVDPAPALLRLRPDAAEHLAGNLPDAELRLEDAGKRFFEIAANRRGDGTAVPAAAILFLSWTTDDAVTIHEVPARDAISALWRQSFYLTTHPGPGETFERLATLADRVPAFEMRRPRDFGRLDECVARVEVLLAGL